jgi:hypothetical protein
VECARLVFFRGGIATSQFRTTEQDELTRARCEYWRKSSFKTDRRGFLLSDGPCTIAFPIAGLSLEFPTRLPQHHGVSLAGYGFRMDSADREPDPFSSESLWRLSRFSIETLQPLEDLPWNADLPSTYPALDGCMHLANDVCV